MKDVILVWSNTDVKFLFNEMERLKLIFKSVNHKWCNCHVNEECWTLLQIDSNIIDFQPLLCLIGRISSPSWCYSNVMVLKNWAGKNEFFFFPLELLNSPDKTVFRELSQFTYACHGNNTLQYISIILLLILVWM